MPPDYGDPPQPLEVTQTMITLQIPEASPSLNEFIKAHWNKYSAMRRHWSMLVLVAKTEAAVGTVVNWTPYPKSRVRIIREGLKLLDEDNLKGGTKPVIDGLRDQRLIIDDSPEHMVLEVVQVRISKPQYPRTRIEIAPAN